jgi:Flp pilus assembly protein TadG
MNQPRFKQTRVRQRGATVVEMSMVLIVVVMVLFGLLDFANLIMLRQLVDNAAREGARLATVSTATLDTSSIQSTVTNYLGGQQLQNVNIQVYMADPQTGANTGDWTAAALGDTIAVQVTGSYIPLAPILSQLAPSVPISATAMMQSEAN